MHVHVLYFDVSSVLCYCKGEVHGEQMMSGADKGIVFYIMSCSALFVFSLQGRIKYRCEKCHYSQWEEDISMQHRCFCGINAVM